MQSIVLSVGKYDVVGCCSSAVDQKSSKKVLINN